AGPEAGQRVEWGGAGGKCHGNFAGEGAAGARAFEADLSARGLRKTAADYEWLPAEQIGKALRVDVGDRQTAPIDVEIGQEWRADTLVEAVGGFVGFVGQGDVFDCAASAFGNLVEQ